MFSTVIDFINNHRLTIVIIIIIVLIVSLLLAYNNEGYEHLEVVPESSTLSNFEGKTVSLKYKIVRDNQPITYYLGFSKKDMCDNLGQGFNECLNNVSVFSTTKNKMTNFKLIKSFTDDRYMLVYFADGDHSMNKLENADNALSTYMCFDGGLPANVYFFLEPNNKGQYRLKFVDERQTERGDVMKKEYYVGFCSKGESVCKFGTDKMPRACSVVDPDKAIFFDIEIVPDESFEPMIGDISSTDVNFNDLESVYSLLTLKSNDCAQESIEGFDDSHTIFSPV